LNSSVIIDTIKIIQDSNEESPEFLELSTIDNNCIELGQDSVLLFSINDIVTSLSLDSELENHNVKLLPNPAKEIVYIETKSSNFDITIVDDNGQFIRSFKNQFYTTLIDINQFNSGIYFIQIKDKTNNIITVHKLIKN